MIKTAILLADGFEEIEALTVVDLLRRAEIGCDMVSLSDSETVNGSHGIRVAADRAFSGTDFAVFDGLILPGPRREKGGNLPVVQRFQPELHGAAAEQRTLLAQYLVLHETDRGTADDEEHIAKLPLLVNGLLQRGGDHAGRRV